MADTQAPRETRTVELTRKMATHVIDGNYSHVTLTIVRVEFDGKTTYHTEMDNDCSYHIPHASMKDAWKQFQTYKAAFRAMGFTYPPRTHSSYDKAVF